MKIAFHATAPFPKLADTDAVFQEIHALQKAFGGRVNTLYPLGHGTYLPWRLFGLHQLPKLILWDQQVDLHHIFSSHLWPFPVLRLLRKPIVYTLVAGLGQRALAKPAFSDQTTIVVTNERDAQTLKDQTGLGSVVVRPAIAVGRFVPTPITQQNFTLLAGSAPWGNEQFVTKGVEALLAAALARPQLRLIFLWREVLYEEMQAQVKARGLTERVEIINRRVDVNELLARCHGTVVLARSAELVKAWPHSLIESLLSGRPVIISEAIPMADYVRKHRCGVIVPEVTSSALIAAIDQLEASYAQRQADALAIPCEDFSLARFQQEYAVIYQNVRSFVA